MTESIEDRFALYMQNVQKQVQVVQSLKDAQSQRLSDFQAAVDAGQDTAELVTQLSEIGQALEAQMSATLDVIGTPPGIVGLTATVTDPSQDQAQ